MNPIFHRKQPRSLGELEVGIRPEGGEFSLVSLAAGATFGLRVQGGLSVPGRSGLVFVGREETRIGGQRGGAWALRLCACLRPRGRGCPARSRVPDVPESAFARPPAGEARSALFLKSPILTVAKALRNTAHCWRLRQGGLAELSAAEGNKRERLRSCPSGCCKTSAQTSRL